MAYANETDQPPNLPGVRNMEALLRCPICFEFLNIAMMTKCSHNFCSLCIRKFLSFKLQCPVCNSPTTEQDLRNNRILEDLVSNYHKVRQELSDFQNINSIQPPNLTPKAPALKAPASKTPASKAPASKALSSKSPRQPGPRDKGPSKGESIMRHFLQKRPSSATATSPLTETQHRHGERPSSSGQNHVPKHSDDSDQLLSVKEECVQEEIAVPTLVPSIKVENTDVSVSEENPVDSPSTSQNVKQVVKVECPVCSVEISQHFINKHLDTCLTRGLKKESLRSSGGGGGEQRQPMAKLVYTLLSRQELKRRLRDCHLSTSGSRSHMVQRLKEFVYIYNSQCDSLQPKSAEDIAKEVEASEKMRHQLDQRQTKSAMVFSKNQSVEEIDQVHSNYRQQHSSEFDHLIAQVRARMDANRRRQQIKQEVEDEERGNRSPAGEAEEPDSNACASEHAQDTADAPGVTPGVEAGSASPSHSDVSISSSISDVFGPEAEWCFKETDQIRKRPCRSGGDDVPDAHVAVKRPRRS